VHLRGKGISPAEQFLAFWPSLVMRAPVGKALARGCCE
jgi:hypothetical protein